MRGCLACLEGVLQELIDLLTAAKRDHDVGKPRTPPPPATPLDFPCCEPSGAVPSSCLPQDLLKIFSNLPRTGPSLEHIDALNASLVSDVPLESLLPAKHLPPTSWAYNPPNKDDYPITISSGSIPAHEAFHTRAKELIISNQDAYRTIQRKPQTGSAPPIRLLFFRKFFDELDSMADYWDVSQDKYTKPRSHSGSGSRKSSNAAASDAHELRKEQEQQGQARGNGHDRGDIQMEDVSSVQNNSAECSNTVSESDSARTAQQQSNIIMSNTSSLPFLSSPASTNDNRSASPSSSASSSATNPSATPVASTSNAPKPPSPLTESLYIGRRTSTGSALPPPFRERTVFAFLETITLPFRSRLIEPRSQLRLSLQGLMLPLPHMASIYRVPEDQPLARRGILEGPLCGAAASSEVCFREEGEERGKGVKEMMHLLKEVGLVLLLAQKRAREGKEEETPGKGKWWAENPRWGGGSGLGIEKDQEIQEAKALEEQKEREAKAQTPPSLTDAARKRVKRSEKGPNAKTLSPPMSTWEKNVKYMRIGMDKIGGGDTDDVSVSIRMYSRTTDKIADLLDFFSQPSHFDRICARSHSLRGVHSEPF